MDEIGSDVIIIQPNEVVKEQESIHKSESLGVVVAEEGAGTLFSAVMKFPLFSWSDICSR